jgi:uncharacterized damage-inducible protein DinB
LEHLSDEEIWWRPNDQSNSMGNILLHLCGNVTQYILSGLGGAQDHRKRSAEFTETGTFSKQELLSKLDQILDEVYTTINRCTEKELLKIRHVQVYNLSAVNIIIHVTEHFSYHTGQIIFFVKWKSGKSMNFYDDKKLEGNQ